MMVNYANEQFHSYVKDTDIKHQTLLTNPVPENLKKAKKLDKFVKDILKEKHKQKDVDQDATFERIQCKNINILGPLSKLWLLIQNALSSQEEEVPIELNKVKEYVEKSIFLLGQATNSMTYIENTTHNILSALNSVPQQSKEMLKEEAGLLQQQDKNMFGAPYFISQIKETKHQTVL